MIVRRIANGISIVPQRAWVFRRSRAVRPSICAWTSEWYYVQGFFAPAVFPLPALLGRWCLQVCCPDQV